MVVDHHPRKPSDLSKIYLDELSARVVAESGRPGDRFHLGKLILQSFRDAPEFTLQIDAATNEMETFGSILDRSTRCATALKAAGIGLGDVVVLMAPNHVHLSVPFYAALYLGIAVSTIDRNLKVNELQNALSVITPKAIFCQAEKIPDIQEVLTKIKSDAHIISFDKNAACYSLQEFMGKYAPKSCAEFNAEDFDTAETVACLGATSGTTGLPKFATLTHKNLALNTPNTWSCYDEFPTPTRLVFIPSPLQWMTAIIHYVGLPMFRITRLQTSGNLTPGIFNRLIKTYKPTWMLSSPAMLIQAMSCNDSEEFDLTSLEMVYLAGSAVPQKLLTQLQLLSPNTEFYSGYGMTETAGLIFLNSNPKKAVSCGQPIGTFKYRLVNPETRETIYEPNVPGELWIKGPCVFKGYYRNSKATEETMADGWFKTGDLFLREEDYSYYFVERLKLLLKYNSYQISPLEIETVIREHQAVQDVAVTGVPDVSCGDLVVACVVRKEGSHVSAQEIKDFIKDKLTDSKQLRGGVIFLDQLPLGATSKLDRRKLKELVLSLKRE